MVYLTCHESDERLSTLQAELLVDNIKEPRDECSSTTNNDFSVKAGNRFYAQALERLERKKARQLDGPLFEHSKTLQAEFLVDKIKEDSNITHDMTIAAGNRLYGQALERRKRLDELRTDEKEEKLISEETRDEYSSTTNNDLSVKAGNRLYAQALERLERNKARQLDRPLSEHYKNKIGFTVEAGTRLYMQGLDQLRRKEMKIAEATKTHCPKLNLEAKSVSSSMSNSVSIFNHLFNLSSEMQVVGKERRRHIEAKIKGKPLPPQKTLPISQLGDMYARCMERKLMQKLKLAEKSANF